MKLGILVSTDRHLQHVLGLADAAIGKGHEVVIFNTDMGTRLLEDESFRKLSERPGVTMSYCNLSAMESDIDNAIIPEGVECGSQLNNAKMMQDVDRVINL